MPLDPKTHHNTHVHVKLELFHKALLRASAEGSSFTKVLNAALEAYLRPVTLPAKGKKR